MSLKAVRKWEKAVPQGPKPDNLTVFKGPPPKPFIPTYERTALRPDIKMLVSMDYRRQWFQECGKFHKFTYPRAERGVLQRKHVPKDAWKKTPACINAPPPPLRKAKRWASVTAKVDSGLGDLASQLGQLVPQCGTCQEFHAAAEKCPATKLCDIRKITATALKSMD
ncbi:uncharacterized protein LOC113208763 [Frankliniella occidentalis]|uniref:Uncharacterized protein LOC113208763 n=1 Tax=Frankliniella occidentalis TaxID=133901 RepID=A0A6J1SLT2_FRAOC|nr:uncharacterized protein LOC113208763 [Frankliniella occidentalis]XP_026281709.1 uncharacterized protein LOC113208763 [Frankliniella occidentalis]